MLFRSHEPGPFLIIRNTFPITFIALLFSEIIKTENTKTLYILHSSYKTQKYIPYHCHNYCHHPCIFIYHHCIFIYYFEFILSLISFSHLVLDNHFVRLRAQSNLLCLQVIKRRIKKINPPTTDSPRVRY